MIHRVARYITAKVLRKKGLHLCPICEESVVSIQEHACIYCELSASWGVAV